MAQRVLIIGGMGRIGRAVADDVLSHTEAKVTLTGQSLRRKPELRERESFERLELADTAAIRGLIQDHDLVVHCAGPFRGRNHDVLESCIDLGVPYVDVADSPDYVAEALKYDERAKRNGVLAVVSTGVFPGISNSMAKQGIELFDSVDEVKMSYLVAGSGGAGVTVMRTTFLELQTPFLAKQNGSMAMIKPYSEREVVEFAEFGRGGVYWFNTVEALTLAKSFPEVGTITTKFGSVPDAYNYMTWLVAQAPSALLKSLGFIEFLSQVSYQMTQVSDRFSGVGISMRCDILGQQNQKPLIYQSTFYSEDTATSAGQGTGMIAQSLLNGTLSGKGVKAVEKAFSTYLFETRMKERELEVLSSNLFTLSGRTTKQSLGL